MAILFITKGQALQLQATWNQGFTERCFDALRSNAQGGGVGATISTAGIGGGSVTVATTAMTNAGWAVDSVAQPGFLVVT